LLIRQQTSVINAIRAHLAEFGIVTPVGRNGVDQLLGIVADASDKRLPEVARACVAALGAQLGTLKAQILQFDRLIMAWAMMAKGERYKEPVALAAVNEIAPDIRRDVKVGRTNST
jgi:transposase